MIRTLLRDPLAHFLLAGAAIWGALALIGDPVDPASRTIELSRERQAGIALGFERMMGRPPTDAEMDAAIARWPVIGGVPLAESVLPSQSTGASSPSVIASITERSTA